MWIRFLWYNIKLLIKVEKQQKKIVLLTYKEAMSVSQGPGKNSRILSDNQEKQESETNDQSF